jgi:hypothetical protein
MRIRPRRAVVLYVAATVAPTLALLYLGLLSVHRQRDAIHSLTAANLQLSAVQLADAIEARVRAAAAACLRDPALATAGWERDGAGVRPLTHRRAVFDRVLEGHPVAAALLLVDGQRLVYPPLEPPTPLDLADVAAEEPPASRRLYLEAMIAAERLEIVERRPDLAVAAYRGVSHEISAERQDRPDGQLAR